MGTSEEVGKVASTTVESLKSQPLALALVIINVLFLLGGLYALHDLAQAMRVRDERKDQLLAELAKDCIIVPPKKESGQ
jgi:hypothetical protein